MKKMRMFQMIIDYGDGVTKVNRIGASKKDVMERYSGNGDYISVKDVTDDIPINIDALGIVLNGAGYGETQINAVKDLIRFNYGNVNE
jgi:hypothetical protein